MTFTKADGTALTKTTLTALLDEQTQPSKWEVTEDIYEKYSYGSKTKAVEPGRRLLWREGKVVTQAELDALFPAAVVSSVTPATGLAAGGTAVSVEGDNLTGVSGITFGGAAATAVTVKSKTEVTCTTPAHAAGAVNVVVTDDSGPTTLTNGFTYT
jgi:hypothetical protein